MKDYYEIHTYNSKWFVLIENSIIQYTLVYVGVKIINTRYDYDYT